LAGEKATFQEDSGFPFPSPSLHEAAGRTEMNLKRKKHVPCGLTGTELLPINFFVIKS
jgi:hypothetical protein